MNIVIYSKPNCPWCVKAKELMNNLGLSYIEKVLDVDYTRDDLKELIYGDKYIGMAQPLTVPQIFVRGKRIGGYEDFAEYCENTGMMGKGE